MWNDLTSNDREVRCEFLHFSPNVKEVLPAAERFFCPPFPRRAVPLRANPPICSKEAYGPEKGGTRLQELKAKIRESLAAVLPVTAIVMLLCITITPMPTGTLMLFLMGAFLLIVGMGLFTLGADMAMMPIGEKVGIQLTKSKRMGIIALSCFIIGVIITIAEPDLTVLAAQTPGVPDMIIILSVAAGVGVFLVVAFFRNLFGWNLSRILLICYILVFVLAIFVPKNFIAVAFDSGGVTTGPITVPFIMALGIGLSAVGRNKSTGGDENFGLIALCSIGPILSVMILGLVYQADGGTYTAVSIPDINSTRDLWMQFQDAFAGYAIEVATALLPILAFFFVFQIAFLRLRRKQILKILVGVLYTFAGLTLFLTGVNVGFMPAGSFLGSEMAGLSFNWILIPLGMVLGFFLVKAEPAVAVLNKQVEDISGGVISQKLMMTGLSIGMSISVGLAMIRVLTGISIFWFLVPGYAIALGLSFVVPKIFTSIAFDSGGVASGPMTATFLLPFAMGACEAVGGDILTDAFGVVAMVAMTPLIIIQLIGLAYKFKTTAQRKKPPVAEIADEEILDLSKED